MIRNKTHKRLAILIGILMVIFLFLGATLSFSNKAYNYCTNIGEMQLAETARQTSHAVKNLLETHLSHMQALALLFSNYEDLHAPQTLELLGQLSAQCPYDALRLTTPDGISASADGQTVQISNREYFLDGMQGHAGITEALISRFSRLSVFAIYAPITRGGKVVGVLHASSTITDLFDSIELPHFNGASYLHILQSDGTVLFLSSNANRLQEHFVNLWDLFANPNLVDAGQLEKVRQNVDARQSGYVYYGGKGERRLAYYTPVGIRDWYVLQSLPITVLVGLAAPIRDFTYLLVMELLILFALLILVIVCINRHINFLLTDSNRNMRISNERFRIAISHISSVIFEYDIPTGLICFVGDFPVPFGLARTVENGPQTLLETLVVEDCRPECANMFKQIQNGALHASACVRLYYEGTAYWTRFMLTNICDEQGRALRAIGTIEDVTSLKEAELRYQQEEQYRLAMLNDALATYEINLTEDLCTKTVHTAACPQITTETFCYSARVQHFCEEHVHPEFRTPFLTASDRLHLLDSFTQGTNEHYMELKVQDDSHDYQWISSSTHLLQDPSTGHIKAFIYVKDIQAQKSAEQALRQKAECDPLTGLYNRATAERLIDALLANKQSSPVRAFFSIDLDGFKTVNDVCGHPAGDALLQHIAQLLKGLADEGTVACRMGGDEFAFFAANLSSLKQVERLADTLCERLCFRYEQEGEVMTVSASIGIAFAPQHGETFHALYERSDFALYHAKRQGKNRYVFFQSEKQDDPGIYAHVLQL